MYSPVFLLTSVLVTIGGAQNIRIASDGLIAATQRSGGLFVQRGDDVPTEIPLPQGYAGFADIALSEDDRLLFALSTSSARGVCSFLRSGDTFTLMGCETRENLSVSPFAGIDAREGVCVVSGGVGGMAVYEYDIVTGILDSSPRFLNQDVENTFGFPRCATTGSQSGGHVDRFCRFRIDRKPSLRYHDGQPEHRAGVSQLSSGRLAGLPIECGASQLSYCQRVLLRLRHRCSIHVHS
jgi:hypothetical protein